MTRKHLRELALATVALGATLLWARPVTATSQNSCDAARFKRWNTYRSCITKVMAKHAAGATFDEFAAFAKCRHRYFGVWANFQTDPSLAGSTCVGNRFVDNGDGTVTDNLTALVWERKTDLDLTNNFANAHDADNGYTWSTGVSPYAEDGTVFTSFLAALNAGLGFAGASGWRLPTQEELQTILLDFPCSGVGKGPRCQCPTFNGPPYIYGRPCVEPAVDDVNTHPYYYWSATGSVPSNFSDSAWFVYFGITDGGGYVSTFPKTYTPYARAVRGGL